MTASKDVADLVTADLLKLRQKVLGLLSKGRSSLSDAHDAYVSAVIGHLFTTLLAEFEPGPATIDKTPEGLAQALNTIGRKLSAVAANLDRSSDYRIQILRREKE
jgi:hypothetical protein